MSHTAELIAVGTELLLGNIANTPRGQQPRGGPFDFTSSGGVNPPCGNASLRCAFAAALAAGVGVGV